MGENTYWIDYRFIEQFKTVDLSNIHEYFRGHPDYDNNCMNEKTMMGTEFDSSRGVVYAFNREADGYFIITKYSVIGGTRTPVEHYMMIDCSIFKCMNVKDVITKKIERITSLVSSMLDVCIHEA